jgi:hypothetical protein
VAMGYNKYIKKNLIIPIALGLLLCSFSIAHRYYFSLTELKVNTPKKRIELSCKLFTDDVEDALFKLNHQKVDLSTSEKNKTVQLQVETYLHERFKIVINGTNTPLHFIGFEVENDVTWFYLESAINLKAGDPVKLTIHNSLLYDFLPDQTNLVHVTYNTKEQTEKLVNPEKEVVFQF